MKLNDITKKLAVVLACASAASNAAAQPGVLQAEDFDPGGEGIGYHDNAAGNAGGQYRTGEDVDIVTSSDPDGGSFDVNNFETGEWLAYTIDLPATASYEFALRAASAFTNSAFHIEVDGRDVTGRVIVPNTGSWRSYQWVSAGSTSLTAGQHTLKVVSDQEYFNLNAIDITAAATSTPYTGVPITVPGGFEAEDFDLGGQNLGYSDNVPGNAGGQHRLGEDVDIVASSDLLGGLYDVNNFETGEWLAYSLDVSAAGSYDIALRVASGFASGAFRIEVDGRDVTGRVAVPNTGGWTAYQWITATAVDLAAGPQTLKIVSDQQYFNLNAVDITPAPVSTPYSGAASAVPGYLEAENFDLGGQDAAYGDNVAGNAGGQYRPGEDVDIVATADANGGQYDVNNFETGEWLAYSIDVANSDDYEIALRVASNFTNSAFRIEIDGRDVSGRIAVPVTGSWTAYQWVRTNAVALTAGAHVLKVVSEQQYFNLNAIEVTTVGTVSVPNPGTILFSCTFPNTPSDCGFYEQGKQAGRASIVSVARDGATGVRLNTQPGDSNVSGSGTAERNDLMISQADTGCYQGEEHWWAHSILFPSDYVAPVSGWGVAFDFHQTGSGGGSTGQANFHVDTSRWDGLMHLRGYGGPSGTPYNSDKYEVVLGPVVRNVWYDFVYHVRWSSGSDGFMTAWLNGQLVLDHRGPTLYTGQGCYLKLANYHTPVGAASAVIHDRVMRGTTPQAVALGPLEGVLGLVNGVLTPL